MHMPQPERAQELQLAKQEAHASTVAERLEFRRQRMACVAKRICLETDGQSPKGMECPFIDVVIEGSTVSVRGTCAKCLEDAEKGLQGRHSGFR